MNRFLLKQAEKLGKKLAKEKPRFPNLGKAEVVGVGVGAGTASLFVPHPVEAGIEASTRGQKSPTLPLRAKNPVSSQRWEQGKTKEQMLKESPQYNPWGELATGPRVVPRLEPPGLKENLRTEHLPGWIDRKMKEWATPAGSGSRANQLMDILSFVPDVAEFGGPAAGAMAAFPLYTKSGNVVSRSTPQMRKMMVEERALRKTPPKRNIYSKEIRELIDDVVESPWFHGRRTYPAEGEAFTQMRQGGTKVGEPTGISLSAEPEVSIAFTRNAKDKGMIQKVLPSGEEVYHPLALGPDHAYLDAKQEWINAVASGEKQAARDAAYAKQLALEKRRVAEGTRPFTAHVFPFFGGRPSDNIIVGWGDESVEEANDLLYRLYRRAAREAQKNEFNPAYQGIPLDDYIAMLRRNYDLGEGFNVHYTKALQDAGFKGMLYSPGRYDEYELKMFNPGDVRVIDMISPDNRSLERYYGEREMPLYDEGDRANPPSRLRSWRQKTPSRFGVHLKDIYSTALGRHKVDRANQQLFPLEVMPMSRRDRRELGQLLAKQEPPGSEHLKYLDWIKKAGETDDEMEALHQYLKKNFLGGTK